MISILVSHWKTRLGWLEEDEEDEEKEEKRKNNGGGGISVKIICKKSLMMSTKDSEVGRVGGSLKFSWGATLNKNNNEWGCVNCVIFTN